MASPTSLTLCLSHTLVIYLHVVCEGKTFAQPIDRNNMELMAPDYR